MKKFLLPVLLCAFMFAQSEVAASSVAKPPHKSSKTFRSTKAKTKTKKVRIHGYDRARAVRKVKYQQGFDYYSYANRKSYLRMMGKAINGDKYYR